MMQRRFSCLAESLGGGHQQQINSANNGNLLAVPSAHGPPPHVNRAQTPTAGGPSSSTRARSLRRTSAQESMDNAFSLLSIRKGSADASVGQLQPDLYRRRGSVISVGSSASGGTAAPMLGRVQLNLSYDHSTSDLVVRVAQVTLIGGPHQQQQLGRCRLRLSMAVTQKSRETGVLPFDATGQCSGVPEALKLPLSYTELADSLLLVELFAENGQQDAPTRQATCSVPLGSLGPAADDLTVWADLERSGEALVRGELLLCMQYLPAAERLTLSLHQASNLRLTSSSRNGLPSDVFVRIQLVGPDDKVLKRRKSTSKKYAQEPTWDEVLTFEVDAHTLPKCRLDVQLLGSDRFGRAERLIGQVSFASAQHKGGPALSTAARLWRDALERRWTSPRWVSLEVPPSQENGTD